MRDTIEETTQENIDEKSMSVTKEEIKTLINTAMKMREKAYCPYSNYSVGVALLSADGEIFVGCNVENASSPAGICAERVAFSSAVASGKKRFKAIAICGGKSGEKSTDFAYPCGICRQVMTEFCASDFKVIVACDIDNFKIYSLDEIIPYPFILG